MGKFRPLALCAAQVCASQFSEAAGRRGLGGRAGLGATEFRAQQAGEVGAISLCPSLGWKAGHKESV